MSGLSRHLKQLDEELLALGEETMLLEELDGFIAGLLVCPDLIKPGEWLPIVWNRDSPDQQPAFDNLDHVNRVLGLVMEHYNSVARTLMERPDRYSPLFSVDTRNGDILWELWIEGFEKAVELRPEAWQKLLNANADTAIAMRGLRLLGVNDPAGGRLADNGAEFERAIAFGEILSVRQRMLIRDQHRRRLERALPQHAAGGRFRHAAPVVVAPGGQRREMLAVHAELVARVEGDRS